MLNRCGFYNFTKKWLTYHGCSFVFLFSSCCVCCLLHVFYRSLRLLLVFFVFVCFSSLSLVGLLVCFVLFIALFLVLVLAFVFLAACCFCVVVASCCCFRCRLCVCFSVFGVLVVFLLPLLVSQVHGKCFNRWGFSHLVFIGLMSVFSFPCLLFSLFLALPFPFRFLSSWVSYCLFLVSPFILFMFSSFSAFFLALFVSSFGSRCGLFL